MSSIDNPQNNDNRNYNYSGFEAVQRKEYEVIASWVEPNSSVIDLACGNGTLLEKIIQEKNVSGKGIELSDSGIQISKKRNLDVTKGSIDERLPFGDNTFDYAICNVTIQMVMYPEVLLSEMKRIAKYQIISFPNFGHYKNRIDLILNGRMPKPMLFGYKWYSTGHVHQLSLNDFFELMEDVGGFKILNRFIENHENKVKNYLLKSYPNLFQILGIFMLSKND